MDLYRACIGNCYNRTGTIEKCIYQRKQTSNNEIRVMIDIKRIPSYVAIDLLRVFISLRSKGVLSEM